MLTIGFSIPVYNTPKELRFCLQSLVEGELPPDQICVVDDTSDSPMAEEQRAIAHEFGAWYVYADYNGPKRFRKTQALNLGASVLSTDIVCYSQGDIRYDPTYTLRVLGLHTRYTNLVAHLMMWHDQAAIDRVNPGPYAEDLSKCYEHCTPFADGVMWSYTSPDSVVCTNGVGVGCNFSVLAENDLGWENRYVSASPDEDDYYNTAIRNGLCVAVFKDLTGIHMHFTERDSSFFENEQEKAFALWEQEKKPKLLAIADGIYPAAIRREVGFQW